jgi:hypothetical protein
MSTKCWKIDGFKTIKPAEQHIRDHVPKDQTRQTKYLHASIGPAARGHDRESGRASARQSRNRLCEELVHDRSRSKLIGLSRWRCGQRLRCPRAVLGCAHFVVLFEDATEDSALSSANRWSTLSASSTRNVTVLGVSTR